jgi:hypothetical protein
VVKIRNVLISFVFFLAIVLAAFFSIRYLDKVCMKFTKLTDVLETSIGNDEWDKSYKTSITFFDDWQKYSDKISIFVHHAEIDNINMELWKLTQYVKEKNTDESLASVHALKFLLEHIANMEKVNIQNIF